MLPEVKTILYCTQMGPRAALIFRYAYMLAEKLDARIVALHVVETLSADQEVAVDRYVGTGTIRALEEKGEEEAKAELERRIRGFCQQEVGTAGCDQRVVKVLLDEGHVALQILKRVADLEIDLVVMGAHARSPVMKAVLGSTAQKVVRGCPVPVLLVRIPEDQQ